MSSIVTKPGIAGSSANPANQVKAGACPRWMSISTSVSIRSMLQGRSRVSDCFRKWRAYSAASSISGREPISPSFCQYRRSSAPLLGLAAELFRPVTRSRAAYSESGNRNRAASAANTDSSSGGRSRTMLMGDSNEKSVTGFSDDCCSCYGSNARIHGHGNSSPRPVKYIQHHFESLTGRQLH